MVKGIKPVIYVDMDGVLVDFVGGAIRSLSLPIDVDEIERWDFYEDFGLSRHEFLEGISGFDFWLALEPLKWWRQCLLIIREVFPEGQIHYLTTLSPVSGCAAGKLQWLDDLDLLDYETGSKMLPSNNKSIFAAENAILIDDKNENCDEFNEAGGHSVLFPQHWNRNREKTTLRIPYLRERLETIRDLYFSPLQPEEVSEVLETPAPRVAARNNSGKPELSQLHHFDLEPLARHCSAGRQKYPDVDGVPNWTLGGKPDSEYLDAAMRHLGHHQRGQFLDAETGTPHLAAVAWNALACLTNNHKSEVAESTI